MDDIRQWHLMLAVLVAATIHTVAMTLYLSLLRPPEKPVLPPPIVFLQSPPPPAVILPPKPQTPPDADIPPIAVPAYDPDLPSVTLLRAEEPPPPEPVTITEPKPEPLDLTQFEDLPPDEPIPVPKAKPAPAQIAAVPVPPAVSRARRDALNIPAINARTGTPSGSPSTTTAEFRWPEKVEDLSPTLKQQLLTEYYVDDKSNWEPWYESRDDAWRRLNMGFFDPTAPLDHIDLQDPSNQARRPPNWDPNEGPLTVQELEETLKKLVAAGTLTRLGREVKAVKDLRYAERQKLLKTHYKDDPRWAIGIVDPKAQPDHIDMDDNVVGRPLNWNPHEGPLTVQELEATLEKLVALGTTPFIGRNVRAAKELTYGERQDILERYYGKDPRWKIGIIDPTVPPDHIDIGDPSHQHVRPTGWDREESPYSIQEIEETLKKMLDRKLKEQGAPDSSGKR